jgi:DNA invertase Pin-like site-specific DNA recombinase
MLNDASRRKFDVFMAWAIDRVGRSLIDLLGTIQHLEAVGVDLYLDQQSIDTTTPAGKLLFQLTGAFAEFERPMIRQRVRIERHQGEARARWQVRLQGWQGAQEAWPAGGRARQDRACTTRAGKGHRHRLGGEDSWPRCRHRAQAQARERVAYR